jgi:hypothetical protein
MDHFVDVNKMVGGWNCSAFVESRHCNEKDAAKSPRRRREVRKATLSYSVDAMLQCRYNVVLQMQCCGANAAAWRFVKKLCG